MYVCFGRLPGQPNMRVQHKTLHHPSDRCLVQVQVFGRFVTGCCWSLSLYYIRLVLLSLPPCCVQFAATTLLEQFTNANRVFESGCRFDKRLARLKFSNST